MKKIILVLGVSLVILITGCGKDNSVTTDSSAQANKKTSVNSEINVAVQKDPNTEKWFKETAEAYEKANPGKKVNIQIIGGAQSEYYTKLKLLLQSDSSIDIVYEDGFMLQSDVAAKFLASIDEIKNWNGWNEIYKNLREAAEINGKVYGVPLSTDTRGLFYNVNILRKAGIDIPWQPKNWQEILIACELIKAKVPDVSPITLNISQVSGEATTMQTLEMLLFGTKNPLYNNGKWDLSSKGMLDSLNFIQELFKKKLTPRIGLLMNPQYGNIVMNQLAPEQNIAIILDGCWMTGRWNLHYPDTLKRYKLAAMPTEFGQEPKFVTLSGGWLLSLSSKTKKKEACLDFIKFAIDKENILKYTQVVSNLSVRKDVADDPAYPAYLKPATDLIQYSKFRPANEQYPIVSTTIQAAVESVATATATPEQAIKTMNNSAIRDLGSESVESEK